MRVFDLHADTPLKLFYGSRPFRDPELQVSCQDLACFDFLGQVFACFCRPELTDDEAYAAFFAMRRRLAEEITPYCSERFRPILAVEDARLLGASRERLFRLAEAGVEILTLLWKGETQIGGAYDTDTGLTRFGRLTLGDALELGIHPDVSHASYRSFFDVAEISAAYGRPFLATHSNAYSVCAHPRNLRDDQFKAVRDAGGLVGLCLYPPHLTDKKEATVYDVIRHLEHWLALGGEDTVALGSDFDGIDQTPARLERSRDLLYLSATLEKHGFSAELTEKFFYKNAEAFFGKYNTRQDVL